jgi:hypothetical protein
MWSACCGITLTWMARAVHPVSRRRPICTYYLLKVAVRRSVEALPPAHWDRIAELIDYDDGLRHRAVVRVMSSAGTTG